MFFLHILYSMFAVTFQKSIQKMFNAQEKMYSNVSRQDKNYSTLSIRKYTIFGLQFSEFMPISTTNHTIRPQHAHTLKST
eukprot:TRINITY_DN15030_c0_g1_i1.p1 TRINITY_DN15030_c0_g1~~TRINITY_DN15030_c0_g1_i1.p1  ORF type:complete len:80 (+),score=3.43 TRINITY_DN15030_c0_g1_i1:259-498(+)